MNKIMFLMWTLLLLTVGGWGQEINSASHTTDINKEIENAKKQEKATKMLIDSLKKVKDLTNLKKTSELEKEIDSLQQEKSKYQIVEKSKNSRISFVVGFGGSYSLDNVYQLPIVSPLDNHVKIELGQRERLTATLGIVYTPYIWKIHDYEHPNGYLTPKGVSFVGFFNPVSILKNSNLEDNFSLSNFGLGIGYKFVSGIGIYGVFEMYSIKQPRQWFIDEFKNGDKSYTINSNIQSSFASDDNNIFRNKLISAIGIKVCYSFDIIRSFASTKEE